MNPETEHMFLEALEAHQHKLLRICSVYAENREEQEDLFQEALINIWQALPSFENRSSISTWMYRITLNVCLRLHSMEARKKRSFIKLNSVIIETTRAEEPNFADEERLARLRDCIRKLNDADRAVVTLCLEELPYREIASITGVTENHVAVLVKRIKAKLLNCINTTL